MANEGSIFTNPVWDRAGDRYPANELSRKLYMLLVCAWTAAGIALSAITAFYSQGIPLRSWNAWGVLGFFAVIFAVSLGGTYIAQKSDNPVISLLGYALVAGPFGVMLGPVVAEYTTASIVKVFIITSAIVLVLGLVEVMIPDNLAPWGTPLMGALLLLIGGYFLVPLMSLFGLPVVGAMTVLDWVGLVIFGALVIFDLNRAARLPFTHDNAVDSAMAIYLDFINIFIRLLSLMGKKN